jgi:hypothetical protein
MAAPIPDDAPVISAVAEALGGGSATASSGYPSSPAETYVRSLPDKGFIHGQESGQRDRRSGSPATPFVRSEDKGSADRPLSSKGMEGEGFNIFGDPDELRERLGDLAEQMQGAQRVAWADNAIKLAVDMTVAAINRLDLAGSSDEQAVQVRDAIRIVFPEAVTLVREARQGLS